MFTSDAMIANKRKIRQLATLFLAMRFKDSLPVLDAKEGSADAFKALVKSMILDYGSSHAADENTVLKDSYGRDIEEVSSLRLFPKKIKNQLFDRATEAAISTEPKGRKVVPISSTTSFSTLFKKNNPKREIITKEVAGRKFLTSALTPKDERTEGGALISKISLLGASPNRDAQLWLAANVGDFKRNYENLFYLFNPRIELKSYIDSLPYQPSTETAEVLKKNILTLLKNAESNHIDERQIYYLKVIEDLLATMPKCRFDNDLLISEQNRLAYSRLDFILNQALKEGADNFDIFFACLEFAFQELQFINAANQNYSEHDMQQTFSHFIQEQYGSEELDTHVLLAGSGMNMNTTLVETALNEVKEVEKFEGAKIYADGSLYFEIPRMMRILTDKSYPLKHRSFTCVEMDAKGGLKQLSDPENEILDVVFSAFEENVGLTHPDKRFRSKDINTLIRNQLQLREQAHSNKRLIVVLDTTMTALNDVQMRELLMTYKDEIQSGQLAIVTAHSLNKYFHMGFDKVPAGLGTAFYNPEKFPRLDSLCKNEWLGDFLVTDPIPQMLTHMVKNVSPQILHYIDIIKGNSRFIHGELVPDELIKSTLDNLVILHQPFTSDIHKDIWGFFTIEVNKSKDTKDIKFSEIVIDGVSALLEKFNVQSRDGYGFNKTGYVILQLPSNPLSHLRVNVGTESEGELRSMLEPAINYITKVNELMELYTNKKFQPYRDTVSPKELKEMLNALLNKELKPISIPVEPDAKTQEYYARALKAEKKDTQQAIIYYRFAALNNHPQALERLGVIYAEGFGVEKDIKKAARYFVQAAESGSSEGMFRLAQCYADGNGIRKDATKSLELYQKAAEKNQPDALFYIGNCYEKGLGLKANMKTAESYYLKAAKLHQPDALFALGTLNESLEKGLLKNGKALEYYHQAADCGHVPALLKIGLYYKNLAREDPENLAEAFKYFQMVVDKGSDHEEYQSFVAEAQRELKSDSEIIPYKKRRAF